MNIIEKTVNFSIANAIKPRERNQFKIIQKKEISNKINKIKKVQSQWENRSSIKTFENHSR